MRPVKPEQVLEIIKAMTNSKSTGLDHLDTYIIQMVTPNILPALTHVINLSIKDGIFPVLYRCVEKFPGLDTLVITF